MELNLEDLSAVSTDDLEEAYTAIREEIDRRMTVASLEQEAEQLAQKYERVTGRKDGDPWTQPHGAHDAYRAGSEVQHLGKLWKSLMPSNVWEPGTTGWREVVQAGSYPEWRQPQGAHDAYKKGDRVSFQGQVYESVFDGANAWSPAAYPPAWQRILPSGQNAPKAATTTPTKGS